MIYRLFAAAAAALLLLSPTLAEAIVVPGERALTPKAGATAQVRLGIAQGVVASATLSPLSDEEVEAVRNRNGVDGKQTVRELQRRVTIGIARPLEGRLLEAADMTWSVVPGGHAAQVAITSPDAGSLRLAIDLAGVPPDLEMVFFGSGDPSRLEGPVKAGD